MSLFTLQPRNVGLTYKFLANLMWLSCIFIFTRMITESNYLVNDDFVMAEFMNGNFTGKFESNTVFMHPIIGSLVSTLYSLNPDISWFAFLIVFIQIIALATLSLLNLDRISSLLLIFLSTAHVAWITVVPTFTPAAIVTTSCGIALILHAINMNLKRFVWLGIFLIIIGGLIRFDGMILALFIFALPFAIVVTDKRNRKSLHLGILAPALILCLGLFSISQTDSICHTQDECAAWDKYNLYNSIRGTFNGTDRMLLLGDDLGNTSWSINDYLLFRNFAFIDDKPFDLETLEKISGVVPNPSISHTLISSPLKPVLAVISSNKEFSRFFFPAFAVFLFLTLKRKRSERAPKYSISLCLLGWLAATSAAATIRFPVRIHEPSLMALGIILLIWHKAVASTPEPTFTRRELRIAKREFKVAKREFGIYSSLLFVLILFLGFYLSNASKLNHSDVSSQNTRVDFIEKNYPGSKFIVAAGNLTDVDPWRNSDPELSDRLLHLGWMTFSPHFEAKKSNLNIKNVYKDLYKSDSLFLISTKDVPALVAQYLFEHFGISSKPVKLAKLPEGKYPVFIWAFR